MNTPPNQYLQKLSITNSKPNFSDATSHNGSVDCTRCAKQNHCSVKTNPSAPHRQHSREGRGFRNIFKNLEDGDSPEIRSHIPQFTRENWSQKTWLAQKPEIQIQVVQPIFFAAPPPQLRSHVRVNTAARLGPIYFSRTRSLLRT